MLHVVATSSLLNSSNRSAPWHRVVQHLRHEGAIPPGGTQAEILHHTGAMVRCVSSRDLRLSLAMPQQGLEGSRCVIGRCATVHSQDL